MIKSPKNQNSLVVSNLHVAIESKPILKGVDITIGKGELHALMGPNGSGKSTLAYALLGHPAYSYRAPKAKTYIKVGKKNLINASTEERAKTGLFLAFQSPLAITGVSAMNLLRSAYQSIHGSAGSLQASNKTVQNPVLARRWQANGMGISEFNTMVKGHAKALGIDEAFLSRGIHDGFSGGEKKKMEMLQALVLSPKFAIFDEIDTGLDVDALKIVARGIELLKKQGTGVIVITHYQRILRYIKPDRVHVLIRGRIAKSGNFKLAKQIEQQGYSRYLD